MRFRQPLRNELIRKAIKNMNMYLEKEKVPEVCLVTTMMMISLD